MKGERERERFSRSSFNSDKAKSITCNLLPRPAIRGNDGSGCNEGEGLDQPRISRARRFNFRVSCLSHRLNKSTASANGQTVLHFLAAGQRDILSYPACEDEQPPVLPLVLSESPPGRFSLSVTPLRSLAPPQSGVSKRNFPSPIQISPRFPPLSSSPVTIAASRSQDLTALPVASR